MKPTNKSTSKMNKILFKLLLFWYATKAKFWDFCLEKVLKHHPTHQYECEQSAEIAQQYEIFLSGKSQTYKGLMSAYIRQRQDLNIDKTRKLIGNYEDRIMRLEAQVKHYRDEVFAWKTTKILTK